MSAGALSAFNSPNIPANNPPIPASFENDNTTLGASASSDSDVSRSKINKGHPLYDDLAPEDSYHNGVYWVSDSHAQRLSSL